MLYSALIDSDSIEAIEYCPVCKSRTWINKDTPCSDHNELVVAWDECEKCSWVGDNRSSAFISKIIDVGNVFGHSLMYKYRTEGQHSAEEFKEDILIPAIEKIINTHTYLELKLDNVLVTNGFLDEVFNSLISYFALKSDHKLQKHSINIQITTKNKRVKAGILTRIERSMLEVFK